MLIFFKVRIQFLNEQSRSTQLWYLIEAKSVCTNQVVGTWKLAPHSTTTDTIYCFNRDDVSVDALVIFTIINKIFINKIVLHNRKS